MAVTHAIALQTAKIALQLPHQVHWRRKTPKTLNPKENLLKNLTYSSALLLTSWGLHRKQILGGS
jgi:hypothetical protein